MTGPRIVSESHNVISDKDSCSLASAAPAFSIAPWALDAGQQGASGRGRHLNLTSTRCGYAAIMESHVVSSGW